MGVEGDLVHGVAGSIVEREFFAVGAKAEACVEAGACAVGPDQEEGACGQGGAVGDIPFCVVSIVREAPSGEVDGGGAGVIEFEPVVVFAVIRVGDGGRVGGLEFIEQDLAGGRSGQQDQACGA